MFSLAWAKDTAERAISTAAQSLLALWGADALDLVHVDFGHSASIAAGAAVLAVLKAVVAANVGTKGTASLVKDA